MKKLRMEAGLSLAKLAAAAEVPQRTIEDIERHGDNADCKMSTAIKLAKALGKTLDELCLVKEEP